MDEEEKKKVKHPEDKERRDFYKQRGVCCQCKEPIEKDRAGRMYCRMCTRTYSDYQALWRDAHPEGRARDNAYHKELREKRKAEHKCTRCGAELPDGYRFQICEKCRGKDKARREKKNHGSAVKIYREK